MTTTVAEQKDKSITRILAERDTALLDVKLTLEEFAAHIEVSYDDRWRQHTWRAAGDIDLYYWIYDHHQPRAENMLSEASVIEVAYERFRAIQARTGQVNFHSVYVKDCEDVEIIPRKMVDYATVCVVQDRVDGLYRYSTSYHADAGGCSSAPSFYSNITDSRIDAASAGAREILESLRASWQAKDNPDKYNPFINKIAAYLENLEAKIRQPSLFS